MVGLALEISLALDLTVVLADGIVMNDADPVSGSEVRATYEGDGRCSILVGDGLADVIVGKRGHVEGRSLWHQGPNFEGDI